MNDAMSVDDSSKDSLPELVIPNIFPYGNPNAKFDDDDKGNEAYIENDKEMKKEGVLKDIWTRLKATENHGQLSELQTKLNWKERQLKSHREDLATNGYNASSEEEISTLEPEVEALKASIRKIFEDQEATKKLQQELETTFVDHARRIIGHYSYYRDFGRRTNIVDFAQNLTEKLEITDTYSRFLIPYFAGYLQPYKVTALDNDNLVDFYIQKRERFTNLIATRFKIAEDKYTNPGIISNSPADYINTASTSPNPLGNFSVLRHIFNLDHIASEKRVVIIEKFLASAIPGETIYVPVAAISSNNSIVYSELNLEDWNSLEFRVKTPNGEWVNLEELEERYIKKSSE